MSTLGRLRLVALLIAGTVIAALVAAPIGPSTAGAPPSPRVERAGSYVPPAGANFNNPLGTPAQQRKLLQQVIRTTKSVPAGATIRMAVFSFGDGQTADALIAAHQRGVNVKLVFAGENVYPAMVRLRSALGTDTSKRSFVVICQNSCRGEKGQMHAKYFSFSRAGSARWITMVGSVNVTQYNAQDQWNDLYTRVDDRVYFRAFGRWFGQLKNDEPVTKQYLRRSTPAADVRMMPVRLDEVTDPIIEALDKVKCRVSVGDKEVRTGLYISTSAWNEERGKAIAWKVVGLRGEGCDVRVFYGTGMGAAVKSILKNNGVRLRKGKHQGVRTHQKVMMVDGGYAGESSTTRAWTGSQNWSTRALNRDDLIVQINEQDEARQYVKRFLWMWDEG